LGRANANTPPSKALVKVLTLDQVVELDRKDLAAKWIKGEASGLKRSPRRRLPFDARIAFGPRPPLLLLVGVAYRSRPPSSLPLVRRDRGLHQLAVITA
jgi:hypothetical protein